MDKNQRKEARQTSAHKLDAVVIPLIGALGIFLSAGLSAEAKLAFIQKIALGSFLAALVFHYLSIEAEANVFSPKISKKFRKVTNWLTGVFNLLRLCAFLLGFVALFIMIARN